MTAADGAGGSLWRHVRIERRGGLAGLHAGAECACAALTAAQRAALDRVVDADRPTAVTGPRAAAAGADRFSYRIHLTHADGQQRVIDVPERALPSALAALVKPALP